MKPCNLNSSGIFTQRSAILRVKAQEPQVIFLFNSLIVVYIFIPHSVGPCRRACSGVIIKYRRKGHSAQNRSDLHTAPETYFDFSTSNAFLSNLIDTPGKNDNIKLSKQRCLNQRAQICFKILEGTTKFGQNISEACRCCAVNRKALIKPLNDQHIQMIFAVLV